ncbi:MAG: hypothetical protein D6729_00935 [Deltaproteobacteria bacterium]|nr:MAG: hypothetical protein D6729_00935 [Deltaproteobacteria bacterium]
MRGQVAGPAQARTDFEAWRHPPGYECPAEPPRLSTSLKDLRPLPPLLRETAPEGPVEAWTREAIAEALDCEPPKLASRISVSEGPGSVQLDCTNASGQYAGWVLRLDGRGRVVDARLYQEGTGPHYRLSWGASKAPEGLEFTAYEAGLEEGFRFVRRGGVLTRVEHYVHGDLEGCFYRFTADGALLARGAFSGDRPAGTWVLHRKAGLEPFVRGRFEAGRLVEVERYRDGAWQEAEVPDHVDLCAAVGHRLRSLPGLKALSQGEVEAYCQLSLSRAAIQCLLEPLEGPGALGRCGDPFEDGPLFVLEDRGPRR